MKIAQVSGFLDPQRRSPEALLSAWPTLTSVATAAAGAGAEVRVFQAAHRRAEIALDGVAIEFHAAPSAVPPHVWVELARAVRRFRPDVVHLHGLGFPLLARMLTRGSCLTPLLVQDHADRPFSWPRVRLQRWGLSRATTAAFMATELAEPFRRVGALTHGTRVRAVPESTTAFTPGDRHAARLRTGVRGNPAIVWVGRLVEDKDPMTVLAAFERVARSHPEARLWCCFGDAPLLPLLSRRIESSATLAARVHLLGWRPHDDVEDILRAADIFVTGSRREGSGYAAMEALACGTPVVLTDIPAFRALLGNGSSGELVPVGDAPAMADALLRLHAADQQALRARVREHFEAALSPAALGRILLSTYRETLHGGYP